MNKYGRDQVYKALRIELKGLAAREARGLLKGRPLYVVREFARVAIDAARIGRGATICGEAAAIIEARGLKLEREGVEWALYIEEAAR